jgi:RsbT co-antagonist protein rsbRD N-terminal domain
MTMITHSKNNGTRSGTTESVADILERELDALIHDWMQLVEKQDDLMAMTLGYEDRTGHLPVLLQEVIARLRLDAGTKAPISVAASHHGDLRRKQGYSVAMVVEESRLLQVCLFTTLHKNTNRLEYSKLLPDVVIIADEVDAQLKQQMLCYMAANAVEYNAKLGESRPN